MRRCYRGVALVLGAILLTGNSLSNSCSLMTLNVYAAEADHSERNDIETEIPADEPDPTPVVEEGTNKKEIYLKLKEYNVLLRIVEAEAGGEDITGKMLVANVIMNRVKSSRFPNTVTEVVYQKNSNGRAQFSPTVDGRFDSVTITQETVDAVERVLNGEDSSNGALYFRSVHSTSDWHDNALSRIIEHGNHIFYTI